jgi:hypothetical protein
MASTELLQGDYLDPTMDSDPAIASQKLQTNLLAIQNWFKNWRMKANGCKPIHVTLTTRKETFLPVHINNVMCNFKYKEVETVIKKGLNPKKAPGFDLITGLKS